MSNAETQRLPPAGATLGQRIHVWGTNRESFWGHFALWRREESLLWWIWTQHARKRQARLQILADPTWSHIRVIRLTTPAEVDAFREWTLAGEPLARAQSR